MGVRTRGLDIKADAAKLKADRAARFEAELVVDRWNRRLATGRDMLWSPTIRAALIAGARHLLPRLWDEPGERYHDRGSSPAGRSRHDGARLAVLVVLVVLVVSRLGAHAEASGLVRVAAGQAPRGCSMKTFRAG
jgi:hypothetical protein